MRNIVIICLDSVRKDIYDKEMNEVKNMVDISLDGCRAASSWSVPSHASFLTGQLPSEHGVHTRNIHFESLSEDRVISRSSSFESSFSISANQFTSDEFGFDTWFDECITLGSTSYFPSGLDVRRTNSIIDHLRESLKHEHPLKSLANGTVSAIIKANDSLSTQSPFDKGASSILRATESSISNAEEPYFLFSNFMEAHHPHRPYRRHDKNNIPGNWSSQEIDLAELNESLPESLDKYSHYISNFTEIYQQEVRYLDKMISSFVNTVQNLSDRETTFIIISDHGENLAKKDDDYLLGHTDSLSEGLLHVPFDIVNPPENTSIGTKLFSLKSLPLLVESIQTEGNISVKNNEYIEAEVISNEFIMETESRSDRMIRAVYNMKNMIKVTWDSRGNAFRCQIDGPSSSRNNHERIENVPDWATNRFETGIMKYKKQIEDRGEGINVQEETKNRLEELGYL